MRKEHTADRRSFLKTTLAGSAALAVTGVFVKKSEGAWTSTTQINPSIPNTRVVSCTDTRMITNIASAKAAASFTGTTGQNSYISTPQVEANMDAMAMALSGKTTASQAWSTIFMKPSTKQWSAVKVAIKVNCIYSPIMPKIPIVGKVCNELVKLGVPAANITLYDACSGASGNGKYTPFIGKGLPAGTVVYAGGLSDPNVPVGTGTLKCTGVLAQQSGSTITYPVDILVNCAVNKGHGNNHGGFTMCMKNHTGTLKYSCPSTEEMITENQCEAVIGGTGGAPCRQQLCIVDSLWSAVGGPGDAATHLLCNIAMGTVAPVVDYQVALKIRKDLMNATPNQTVIDSWLTRFNVAKANLEWFVVPPATVVGVNQPAGHRQAVKNGIRVSLDNGSFKRAAASFDLSPGNVSGQASITDMSGRIVRTLELTGKPIVSWDGRDNRGRSVKPGFYIIGINAEGVTHSAGITVAR